VAVGSSPEFWPNWLLWQQFEAGVVGCGAGVGGRLSDLLDPGAGVGGGAVAGGLVGHPGEQVGLVVQERRARLGVGPAAGAA
jgi:hypothetical protein